MAAFDLAAGAGLTTGSEKPAGKAVSCWKGSLVPTGRRSTVPGLAIVAAIVARSPVSDAVPRWNALCFMPQASIAAFIEGAATARSKKPMLVTYVLSCRAMALDGTIQRQLGGRAAVISSLKFLGDATQPMAVLNVADTGHIAEINMLQGIGVSGDRLLPVKSILMDPFELRTPRTGGSGILILSLLILSFIIPSFLIPSFLVPSSPGDEG